MTQSSQCQERDLQSVTWFLDEGRRRPTEPERAQQKEVRTTTAFCRVFFVDVDGHPPKDFLVFRALIL